MAEKVIAISLFFVKVQQPHEKVESQTVSGSLFHLYLHPV